MLPFILLLIYLFTIWGITGRTSDRNIRLKQCVLSGIGLLFLLGLHSPELGIDVRESYSKAFAFLNLDFVLSGETIYGFEKGFVFYTALIKSFSSDFQVYLFITATLIIIPILYLFYKHSSNLMFSIILYATWQLYYFSFSGIRQALAISVIALASHFLINKKLPIYFILVLIASLIHTSAFLFIIAYPIFWSKISDRLILIYGMIGIVTMLFSRNIIVFVAEIIFGSDNRYTSQAISDEMGGITIALIYLAFVLLYYNLNRNSNKHFLGILMLLCLIQFSGMYSQTVSRIGYYFIPSFCLAIPQVILNVKGLKYRIIKTSVLFIALSIFFKLASTKSFEITPFKFFWE